MWAENFQMFNLDLEKAEGPEIKFPTSTRSQRKQESSRKTSTSALLTTHTKDFDCVDQNKLWKILKEIRIPDHITSLLKNCMQVKKQQLELDMEQCTGSKLRGESVQAV